MTNISSISSLLLTQSLMLNNQTQLNQLSTQLSTGTKSQSLSGYGNDASKVLSLQGGLTQQQAYVTNNSNISTVLSTYDTTLTQLTTDATRLQSSLHTYSVTDSATVSALSTLTSGLVVDIGATLNAEVGDKYLYSGTRYDTAPVDLTQLTPLTSPIPFSAVTQSSTPSNLPAYDTQAPNDTTGKAYALQKVSIGDSNTITYGITSNDPAIQQLIYAVQSIQAGSSSTGATQQQYFTNASNALSNVITGLQTLQQGNAQNQSLVSNATTTEQTAIDTLKTQQSNLESVNSATVAAEITAIQNQLDGTYKVTASLLNLSLLNYLK